MYFKKQIHGFEILEAGVMFFTFPTFTKINIVVNMSAAGRISVVRNIPPPPFFFTFQSNQIPFSFWLHLSLNCLVWSLNKYLDKATEISSELSSRWFWALSERKGSPCLPAPQLFSSPLDGYRSYLAWPLASVWRKLFHCPFQSSWPQPSFLTDVSLKFESISRAPSFLTLQLP